eukprot:320789-Rhodomonas_salina.1
MKPELLTTVATPGVTVCCGNAVRQARSWSRQSESSQCRGRGTAGPGPGQSPASLSLTLSPG